MNSACRSISAGIASPEAEAGSAWAMVGNAIALRVSFRVVAGHRRRAGSADAKRFFRSAVAFDESVLIGFGAPVDFFGIEPFAQQYFHVAIGTVIPSTRPVYDGAAPLECATVHGIDARCIVYR